jgi:hypothetical protein
LAMLNAINRIASMSDVSGVRLKPQ